MPTGQTELELNQLDQFFTEHLPWASPETAGKIQVYCKLLEFWNKRINLTGIPIPQWLDKIISESAVLTTLVPQPDPISQSSPMWMDMGTGAGIPGLIIASMLPKQKIILVDSRRKKTDFIQHAISEMRLNNTDVINERLENIPSLFPYYSHAVSVFFSRALADLKRLSVYADPLAKDGSILISPRGDSENGNGVLYSMKTGRVWSGKVYDVSVPGFNRSIKCAKLSLTEAVSAV
jgi:16S rRNA (guanine527-N7)-methyltransferase